jgi:O-acetyl-ADP-ribose deacetylase (regulator of RNase III)
MQPAMNSPPRIHFVSLCREWVDAMRTLFSSDPHVQITCDDIANISLMNPVIVSPANSLGYMDGGIDKTLSRDLFPGLEDMVQQQIRDHGVTNAFGRYFLPIGSAIRVSVESATIIVAPTMFRPQDVSYTQNAYWSFLAALLLFNKVRAAKDAEFVLVATSHCCGYGRMNPLESAKQMRAAYDDVCTGHTPPDMAFALDDTVVLPTPDEPNPYACMESEIKEIIVSS